MCISPIYLKDTHSTVPCGVCVDCVSNKRNSWSIRLYEEQKVHNDAWFITLTYDDLHIPCFSSDTREIVKGIVNVFESETKFDSNILLKKDLQDFMKRLRKLVPKRQLKYYAVGEYGDKFKRPHYHIIMFNLADSSEEAHLLIQQAWTLEKKSIGRIDVAHCSPQAINYVTKYVQKNLTNKKAYLFPPFSIMSKGLGKAYIDANKNYHNDFEKYTYTFDGGMETALPRYYKDKLFTEGEREAISTLTRWKAEEKEYNTQLKEDRKYWESQDNRVRKKVRKLENELKKREL